MKDTRQLFASRFAPPGWKSGGGGTVCIPSLTGCSDAFLALALSEKNQIVLAVTSGIPDAERLADDLHAISGNEVRILEFPPLLKDDKSSLGIRLKTMAAIKAWGLSPYPCVVVAPFHALETPLPKDTIPRLTLGTDPIALVDICDKLAKMGYHRVPVVSQEGDFAVRGGIVDVWSPGEEYPVRAEFFGDELESLRTFNPATQISIARISTAEFLPASADEDSLQADGNSSSENNGDSPQKSRTVLSLLPQDVRILALEHNNYDFGRMAGDLRPECRIVYTGDPAPKGVPTYAFQTVPLPGFSELGADEAHHPELFDAARRRLEQHLEAAKMRGLRILEADGLSGGFEIEGLVVVTKADRVFTRRRTRTHATTARANAANTSGERISDFDDIEPGEYVVHVDYGVGRYIGSSEIVANGKRSEVFTVEYADGGKLHVPAAHAHLLSRYIGVRGEEVRLHRLDGKRWEKDKENAQRAVSDLAAALLDTQARRETAPGFAYDVENCDGLDAFEAAFPYEETPDQAAAIAEVKADMSATKPMDRLICGDAGYGKTEVAMRAAYIAAMNGKQVAVLAPTTILAEQHFETFCSRFDGTPVRIEAVSRFQSGDTRKGTMQRLAAGVCDIVVGTHAILTDAICFHDLGLIIIDEEQRFGVKHKEFLKRLRATADVLTLSATPIPRTLYLSMTGARDLSLIKSPPRERVAVETKIVRDSDDMVRSAIDAEIARGGQVYFLHNRVASISKVEKRLHGLCPAARITVAHGQMDSRTLAKKMRDFERGKYDVLLSTTIVESGIDIPRANTIVVDRADMFGLADLYQLRGRVGRSARQGYAYLLLPPSGIVDAEARERLSALRRHGGLGAGFNLAVRDLELRGAGNLLGSQQSGHIAAVGFGLYCQLLKRTIAMLKGEKVREVVDVKINLSFTNPSLSYEYIEEDAPRMSLMRRFAEAQDMRVVRALEDEMRDRFGPPPPEAKEFVGVASLRVACAAAGIGGVDEAGGRAVFYRAGSRDILGVVMLKSPTAPGRIAELIRAAVRTRRSRSP